jgi:uncharacterized protein involved in exopolysaccharide biosynthesis
MTSSGLKRLISPAICFPSFCPISSTISIHKRSSLFTEAMISSSVIGLLTSPIRLDKIEFSPFCIRSNKIRCSAEPEELGDAKINPFCLTPDQAGIADALSHRISVSVDKKTGVTTLSVTMQDPLISAALTDTVMHCLQNYITDYRTNKARHDLAFTEKLFDEAQGNYYEAQQKYAHFMDGNQNIIMQSFRTEQERLQNEVNLAYGVFTQVAQQLQVAKAKVQEITPVYTVVQPATVPLRPAKPNKIMILIGFVFLAGVGSIGWILFVKDLLNGWKKQPEK